MPASKPKVVRRRDRCAQCQRLTNQLVDYWPNGQPVKPRYLLCLQCYEGVVMFGGLQNVVRS